MDKIYKWANNLTKQKLNSLIASVSIVGIISTVLSILGISLGDLQNITIWVRIVIVFIVFILIYALVYLFIGRFYKDSVEFIIHNTSISISHGDIFKTSGWRVIGFDTHFNTRIDDEIISKSSLQGQLLLQYGDADEIKEIVKEKANEKGCQKDDKGLFNFPLGTVIRYDSKKDDQTYLLLALTKLNDQFESHTNMAEYELMLMNMWKEIDRVYASNDIVLPVLGDGITRFDSGPQDRESLLRCMLCTFNSSGVSLNSKIKIVLYGDTKNIALYEYKDMFHKI